MNGQQTKWWKVKISTWFPTKIPQYFDYLLLVIGISMCLVLSRGKNGMHQLILSTSKFLFYKVTNSVFGFSLFLSKICFSCDYRFKRNQGRFNQDSSSFCLWKIQVQLEFRFNREFAQSSLLNCGSTRIHIG